MKILLTLTMIVMVLACSTNKSINQTSLLSKTNSNCPADGICTFEVLKNKRFSMKKDEFGIPYSEILEGKKTVLKYEYKRNTPKDVQDGNYSETIYIEIENDAETLNLKDNELSNANIGFSRLCFCRGQTGTYPVKLGNLNLLKTGENIYTLKLDFKVSEVPQIITSINETFELK